MGSPPLSFKAGGKNKGSSAVAKCGMRAEQNSDNGARAQKVHQRGMMPPARQTLGLQSSPRLASVIQTGLSQKRSPLQVKNWIACVLTLDGRDKFTKVLQYTSRLLCWYFAGLAKKTSASIGGSGSTSSAVALLGSASLLGAVYTNLELRQQYYSALSKRFDALYKSLVTSRKAFRLGRSIIEWDKITSMGWGEYLSYMLMHPLAGGVADAEEGAIHKSCDESKSVLTRYDTHPIPEEEGSRNEDDHGEDDGSDDESSWNGDENGDAPGEEKKLDVPTSPASKVVSRPGRPKLPTRISSNVGWGPSTTSSSEAVSPGVSPSRKPPPRTVSEMGRQMYRPFPSRSSSMGSYKQVKDASSTALSKPEAPTPSWKLIGGTLKLLGLMGFWAFDNLAFLTGSGFLDPISGVDNAILVDPKAADRLKRKKSASEWGARCYFIGILGGLYVNARSLWIHRRDKLNEAHERLRTLAVSDGDDAIQEAQANLKQTQQKHFELMLALVKSCCDFMVFSNNPGIDLHLKFRGKKNHEGLHCLGGLVSASTVLYSNFPNAK